MLLDVGPFTDVSMLSNTWENQDTIDAARAAVAKAHAESGFNPQETMARLGIEADIANYKPIIA